MAKKEEQIYVLSEAACMQLALRDFGVEVSARMAEAIANDFMILMERAGHIEGGRLSCD